MDADKTLKDPFIQVVDDHLASNDPPETKAALDKLVERGRSMGQAKSLVASVVRLEMQDMMAKGREFDNAGYAAALQALLAQEE